MRSTEVSSVPANGRIVMMNCLAKAVYDNMAESPDELAFRKGDVLTVLEQNTNGLEGWWLCSLRGRQGICPGNRLRLLAGMYDGVSSNVNPNPLAKRRSCLVNPNKVVTPYKVGDVYFYDDLTNSKMQEYDVPPTCKLPASVSPYPVNNGSGSLNSSLLSVSTDSYDVPPSQKLSYDVPQRAHVKAHSPVAPPSLNLQSGRAGEMYDVPRPLSVGSQDYDVPRGSQSDDGGIGGDSSYDVPPSHHITVTDAYDVPPTAHVQSNRSSGVSMLSGSSCAMSPSSSACSLTPSLSLSSLGGTGSNRSSLEQQHELYDIPPNEIRKVGGLSKTAQGEFYDTPPRPKPTQVPGFSDGVYDVPPQVTKDTGRGVEEMIETRMKRLSTSSSDSITGAPPPVIHGKELPLELTAAMDTLIRLQQEVHGAITKLFSFVSASWRCKENLENKVYDIRLSVVRMRTALQEFVDFAQGALVNSTRASDKMLCHKLAKLVAPLRESNSVIQKTSQVLDEHEWAIGRLMENGGSGIGSGMVLPDELDQLVSCARELTEDVRQVASFIQGNSTLLFKRSPAPPTKAKPSGGVQERPLPPPPMNKGNKKEENVYENDAKDWIEDYDYVNLESKEAIEKENEEIKAALPKDLRKSFENILKESEVVVDESMTNRSGDGGGPPGSSPQPPNSSNPGKVRLDANDRQVLQFYGEQVETHITFLTNAIDAFLATIENNQPPKVFIGHSKFVVLSAHKLVYIGDTVHRNTINVDIRNKVMLCSNALCDALKATVQSTKTAALQFPSVIAVQEMVDSVVDISHSANELKVAIGRATKL